MSDRMKPGCFFPALALIAALCMALASVASAARMAPVGQNAPAYLTYLANGGVDDLCAETDHAHRDHDCPFCRLLADPDNPPRAHAVWQLDPWQDVQALRDLTVFAQLHQQSEPARGPPATA